MEVRHLEIFCVLAEELNFTRTAQRVHTVQFERDDTNQNA